MPINAAVNDHGLHWQISVDNNKTIYFGSGGLPSFGEDDIFYSEFVNGIYQTPVNLGQNINSSQHESTPYIDPQGRFILFFRSGIWISKKIIGGTWSQPERVSDLFPEVIGPCAKITPDGLYLFFMKYVNGQNQIYWVDASVLQDFISTIDDKKLKINLPDNFNLMQNYPNPFNLSTTIEFAIPKLGFVTLKVFDALGNEIANLVSEKKSAGNYKLKIDESELPGGVYFYQLKTREFSQTRKNDFDKVDEDAINMIGTKIITSLIFLLVGITQTLPQSSVTFELIAEYDINVLSNWLTMKDDLTYITTLNGMTVLNISDPYNPSLVGNLSYGSCWQIDVENDYAYFIAGGVVIVNIAQPGNYSVTNTIPKSNYTDIKVKGNYIFLTKLKEGFNIIDVTDPLNPIIIFSLNEPGNYSEEWSGYSHLDVSENYLYVGESENEILIYDINNIMNPQEISSIPVTQFVTDVVYASNLLFVGTFDDLKIYDVSNPSVPDLLSIIEEVQKPAHINSLDNIVVLYDDNIYRYYAIDISNPSSPQILGYFDTVSHAINFNGEFIYAAGEKFRIYKLNFPADVHLVNESPDNFFLYQNYPNPFNPTTTISYSISVESFTTLKIYDILGNEVTTLINEEQSAGEYEVNFNGNDLIGGIYLYSLKAGSVITTKKMCFIK